jgi:hypothetical protein
VLLDDDSERPLLDALDQHQLLGLEGMAGTIMEATTLPLTIWFLAFYLIGQAKTSILSLQLS